MDGLMATTELFREVATLIMLVGIGVIVGRNNTERFAWFLYSFAIWDIFYYVFLKALLNWPESLMTWDILFVLPVTWVGPVISPVIVAFTMIVFALLIIYANRKHAHAKIESLEWTLLITGSVILIIAFTWDYSRFVLQNHSFSEICTIPKQETYKLAASYMPQSFNWWIFLLGEIVIIAGIISYWKRMKNKNLETNPTV